MRVSSPHRTSAALVVTVSLGLIACSGREHDSVERGAYLATIGGCHDCHTPKVFSATGPELDQSRLLAGHPASDVLPGLPLHTIGASQWGAVTNVHLTAWAGPWGVSYAANLTPDATGLRDWTVEQFIATMRSGKHAADGRALLPPMPWNNYAQMSKSDLRALFAYLRSLPPVANAVPPPVLPVPPAMATAPTDAGS
jgi:hypothetical protein